MNLPALLTTEEAARIRQIAEGDSSPTQKRIARVLLAYQEGMKTRDAAQAAGLSLSRTRFWRRKFRRMGMDVFEHVRARRIKPGEKSRRADAAEPGEEAVIEATEGRTAPAPNGYAQSTPPAEDQNTSLELPLAPDPALDSTLLSLPAQPAGPSGAPLSYPLPAQSAGVLPEDPMAEAGRKILLYQFAEMLAHEDGTRLGEDIEELHDMRVATRRMRAAFDLFGEYYAPKMGKKLLTGLKLTGRTLGAVRDMDVFIENGRAYAASLPEADQQGLVPLITDWQQEREIHRREMLAHLNGDGYQRFKEKMNRFVQTPGMGAITPDDANPIQQLVRNTVPQIIYSRLANVRAYETVLANASLDQLHALRIEAKKLRYAVEFFREVLGPEAKEVINTLKKLQDHLGELNDARVACQLLSAFLEKWEMRQAALPLAERISSQPLVTYLAASYSERHRLMLSFPDAWTAFISPEFRQKLALAVSVL